MLDVDSSIQLILGTLGTLQEYACGSCPFMESSMEENNKTGRTVEDCIKLLMAVSVSLV